MWGVLSVLGEFCPVRTPGTWERPNPDDETSTVDTGFGSPAIRKLPARHRRLVLSFKLGGAPVIHRHPAYDDETPIKSASSA